MLIFFVFPVLINGFGSRFVPTFIGANCMAFPRLNSISFWLLVFSLPGLLVLSLLIVGPLYPVLAEKDVQVALGVFIAFNLALVSISLLVSSINFIITIITRRAPQLLMRNFPVYVWAIFITSFLVLFLVPASAVICYNLEDLNFLNLLNSV